MTAMTQKHHQWSLGENTRAIASRLEDTGRQCIVAAEHIAEDMRDRNQTADSLNAGLRHAAAELRSITSPGAIIDRFLDEATSAWRSEEILHRTRLDGSHRALDASAVAVHSVVNSVSVRAEAVRSWDSRAQESLALILRLEESVTQTMTDCGQLLTTTQTMQSQLGSISQEVLP